MAEPVASGNQEASRLLLVALLFVAGRLVFLTGTQPSSDVSAFYARYAYQYELARRHGVTVYEERARVERERAEEYRRVEGREPRVEGAENIEYPPLAMEFLRLPMWLMRRPRAGWGTEDAFTLAYVPAYRTTMALVDVVLAVLVIGLVRRLFRNEGPGERVERQSVYVLATLAVWPLLYDRMDLVVGFLLALALWLLVSGRALVSLVALAAAINFKLVPVVAAPAWILGSMPYAAWNAARRWIGAVAIRSLVLIALVAAMIAPFVAWYGAPAIGFFQYHRSRGIEIDTLYSSVLMALGGVGYPVQVYGSHNGVNITSAAAPVLSALAPFLAGVLLLLGVALILVHARKRACASQSGGMFASVWPAYVAAYALLLILLFMTANKVFSPQYVLWIAPLIPLAPLAGASRRWFLWIYVTACAITTLLFPFLYWTDIAVRQAGGSFGAPTLRGALLLGVRNGLFVSLPLILACQLWRDVRAGAGARRLKLGTR